MVFPAIRRLVRRRSVFRIPTKPNEKNTSDIEPSGSTLLHIDIAHVYYVRTGKRVCSLVCIGVSGVDSSDRVSWGGRVRGPLGNREENVRKLRRFVSYRNAFTLRPCVMVTAGKAIDVRYVI